ncbi:LPXTG cell wall anchor domain-containing protein [Weissella viridescens]|uniref:LPXTG cell wall anchor domain-containing protein n=1 Tax=Weissella viridescens TaxID=1629 RepID=UPI003AF2DF6D
MNYLLLNVNMDLSEALYSPLLLKVTDGNIGVEPSDKQNTTVVNKQQPLVTVKPDEMPNTGMELDVGLSVLGGLLLLLVIFLIYLCRKKR